MNSNRVVILSSARTPIGSFNGCLSSKKASELGAVAIKEALCRAKVEPNNVSEVVVGQVLTAGQGQNPARQAAVEAGLPYSVPATSINMLCGSGLRSIMVGCQSIKCGDANIVVCAGQESMSQAPHVMHIRAGVKMGNTSLVDSMTNDGLTDAFNNYHMGITAENISQLWNINRADQDKFSVESQNKTESAQKSGHFKEEIVGVSVTKQKVTSEIVEDEYPKQGCTLESLQKLRPCFLFDGRGTVTPGNASGINDGAAAVVISSDAECKRLDLTPIASVVAYAQTGVDPSIMGTGPISAVKLALSKAKWDKNEVDLWELNEAFAVQSLAVIRELGLDQATVNISGGAIALGHPIGASGTRIVVTLLHNLRRLKKKRGVAALCVGGGMGIAICIEML